MWSLTPGVRLNDRFLLREPIGSGGMSQVWRADDELLGRKVAVKMLLAEIATDSKLSEAIWREARAAAQVTHPHVTRVYDHGQATLSNGTTVPFLVMELVEGQDLATRLAAGALHWRDGTRIGAQIAAALAAAHQLGVVHRDIKPSNVMLTSDGAKVLDFGVALMAGTAEHDTPAGTPTYAAPERLLGVAAHPAGDIYSLGVVLHETLTGRPPAVLASWADAVEAHRTAPPVPDLTGVAELPTEVDELVSRCLALEPTRRPAANDLAERLAQAVGLGVPGHVALTVAMPQSFVMGAAIPPQALPATQVEQTVAATPPGVGRRLWLAGVLAGALVLALVALLVFTRDAASAPEGTDHFPVGQSPTGHPPTQPSATQPAAAPWPSVPDPASAYNPLDVVATLHAAISHALRTGQIDGDAAAELRDELSEIEEEFTDPDHDVEERIEEVQEAAGDMLEEIEDLYEDGELPESVAEQLRTLLIPLLQWRG